MSVRARFFDDYRLSRIEEEIDRLSLQSDISCSVDTVSGGGAALGPPSSFTAQRSASADGTLQSTGDDDTDDDDYELPLPPPPQMSSIDLKPMDSIGLHEKYMSMPPEAELISRMSDIESSIAAARALNFMQAKYDSLGKVKVTKPAVARLLSPTTATPNGDVIAAGSVSTTSGVEHPGQASGCRTDCTPMSMLHDRCSKMQSEEHGHDQCGHATPSDPGQVSVGVPRNDVATFSHQPNTCLHCGGEKDDTCSPASQHRTSVVCSSSESCGVTKCNRLASCNGNSVKVQHLQHNQLHRHVVEKKSTSHHHHQQQPRIQSPATSTNTSSSSTLRRSLPLTTAEQFQVDLFYRSYKTVVHVSSCTATLYIGSASVGSQQEKRSHVHPQIQLTMSNTDWKPAATGIPVVMFDQKHQPGRLSVVLAERGTGFELWRQVIDKTEQYLAVSVNDEPVFHVVNCPTDGDTHRNGSIRQMGLRFDDLLAATEFHRQLLRLADHDRMSFAGRRSGKTKKLGKGGKGKRTASFSKADISQPCCFTHVTRLERDNGSNALFNNRH